MIRLASLAGGGLATALAASGAVAQEAPWQFRVTPYLWAPTMLSDTTVGANPPVSTETSVLDVLDIAFLGAFEARRGRWGVFGEVNYLSLSSAASSPGGLLSASAELSGFMVGAAVAYRVHEDPRASVDVFAGARYWALETEVSFRNAGTFSRSTNLFDPVVGLRGQYSVTDRWFVAGLAEIGGFGVGTDFQWEVIGSVGYRWSDSISVRAGWRHLALDLDDGGLVLDAALTGPFLALDISF